MKKILLYLLLLVSLCATAQQKIKRTVFQAFWWDYYNSQYPNGWSNYLCELAPRLKAAGFNAVWIPPSIKNSSPNSDGYVPFDYYDLGDKFQKGGSASSSNKVYTRSGTKDELLRMIAVMHANGIEVIEDVVLGHMNDAGSSTGAGGQDTYAATNYSDGSTNGYKNFRNVSYATPAIDESQNDYWSRSGRWPKNWENFYPNQFNNSYNTNNINSIQFGPQISFESNAYGQSSSMVDGTSVTIGSTTRKLYNPSQYSNYMYTNANNWLVWFKKQTGVDGWRWDAAKNMYGYVVRDLTVNTKYNAAFANGGQNMFCVTEYVDSKNNLDSYISSIENSGDLIAGTFDFNLRAYGSSGGIYGMVTGLGNYNMQSLPGEQQYYRYMDYADGTRVHRTVPFVNNHDTFRPILDSTGKFSQSLGVSSGWNNGSELSGHIDPREPRLAAAYATISAMDGNPTFFIEDVFDLGTTGKRYTHLATNTTDLPIRGDLVNIVQAHQALKFKDGDYGVATAQTGGYAPYYSTGNSGDHLIIERKAKVIIGITDAYSTVGNNTADQQAYITTNFPIGTVLYDFSGAHGINSVTVTDNFGDQSNHRVLIQTSPNGHTIANVYGHGYSIWAPYPNGTPNSVNDLFNYLANNLVQTLSTTQTTQEWEMADDLGDSHCNSLGQGGALPNHSTNQRVAGKIFAAAGKSITYKIYPEVDGMKITAALWDLDGNKLSEINGASTSASPITGNYTPNSDEWITIKVHYTDTTQITHRCWVNVAYTAPTVVDTRTSTNSVTTRAAIWTGNKGTTDISDCGNWEEGITPSSNVNLIIPANSSPFPQINTNISVKNVIIEAGAYATISQGTTLTISGVITNNNTGKFIANKANIILNGSSTQTIPNNLFDSSIIQNLTINNTSGVSLNGSLTLTGLLTPTAGIFNTNNNLILASTANGTAAIGAGSGSYLTGNVTVQRYVQGKRAFRFFGHPFNSSLALNNVTSVIDITGIGGNANGFTTTATNNPSAFWYDPTTGNSSNNPDPGWTAFTNANTLSWAKAQGIRLLIRGAKGEGLTGVSYTPSAATFNITGTVNTGTQVVTLTSSANSNYNLIGNPYPSPIDLSLTTRGSNIGANFYVWDATAAGTNGRGAYVSQPFSNSYILPSWGSFFATTAANNNNTITFNESNKSISSPVGLFGTANSLFGANSMQLRLVQNSDFYDRILFFFDKTGSSAKTDWYDADKLINPDANFNSISADNKALSIDARPIDKTMTIPLYLSISNNGGNQQSFSIKVPDYDISSNQTLFLHDKLKNSYTTLGKDVTYDFDVNLTDSATQYNRFEITSFKLNQIVPIDSSNAAGVTIIATANQFIVQYHHTEAVQTNIHVISTDGKLLLQQNEGIKQSGKVVFNTTALAQGSYVVEVITATSKIVKQVLKQ